MSKLTGDMCHDTLQEKKGLIRWPSESLIWRGFNVTSYEILNMTLLDENWFWES